MNNCGDFSSAKILVAVAACLKKSRLHLPIYLGAINMLKVSRFGIYSTIVIRLHSQLSICLRSPNKLEGKVKLFEV